MHFPHLNQKPKFFDCSQLFQKQIFGCVGGQSESRNWNVKILIFTESFLKYDVNYTNWNLLQSFSSISTNTGDYILFSIFVRC